MDEELKIISLSKKDIEVEGSFDETFARMLVSELLEMENVQMAECIVDHPPSTPPRIYMRVNSGSPREALIDGAKRLREKSRELRDKLGAVG